MLETMSDEALEQGVKRLESYLRRAREIHEKAIRELDRLEGALYELQIERHKRLIRRLKDNV